MPSPFPGLDPYLEQDNLWRDVHLALISAIQRALAPAVAPHYYVALDVVPLKFRLTRASGPTK